MEKKRRKQATTIVGVLFFILGLADVPDQVAKWLGWLGRILGMSEDFLAFLSGNGGRWLLTVVGSCLALWANDVPSKLWTRLRPTRTKPETQPVAPPPANAISYGNRATRGDENARPQIVLRYDPKPDRSFVEIPDAPVFVENVGDRPAFEVQIGPIRFLQCTALFDPISQVDPRQPPQEVRVHVRELDRSISPGDRTLGYALHTDVWSRAFESGGRPRQEPVWPLSVRYRDFVGTAYETPLYLVYDDAEQTARFRLRSRGEGDPPVQPQPSGRIVTSSDWRELAARFKENCDPDVRADWHKTATRESWDVRGGGRDAVKDCEAFCKMAGVMLLASPNLAATLSQHVRSQTDPIWRWLYFLKETTRDFHVTLHGVEVNANGAETSPVCGGGIENVTAVSARACIECAAQEIG